jgi:hypothetical protein
MLTKSKTKKMGRPKLAKGAARYELIATRISADESKKIHAAIERSKEEKPDWVRNALLSAANK